MVNEESYLYDCVSKVLYLLQQVSFELIYLNLLDLQSVAIVLIKYQTLKTSAPYGKLSYWDIIKCLPFKHEVTILHNIFASVIIFLLLL